MTLTQTHHHTPKRTLGSIVSCVLITLLMSACESPGPSKQEPSQQETEKQAIHPTGLSELDKNLYIKAVEQLAQGKIKKGQKTLLKLEKKYQSHAGIQVNLANAFFQQKNFDGAKKHCEFALRIDKTIADTHNLLGLIAVEKKQFKQAQTHYEQALSLDKKYANAHYNIALLYDIYFQNIAKAYHHYEKYLALVPDDQETQDWLDQLKYSLEQ